MLLGSKYEINNCIQSNNTIIIVDIIIAQSHDVFEKRCL